MTIRPASVAEIDYAVKNVAYQNTLPVGTETQGTRTVSYSVTDGYDNAGPVTRDVNVTALVCAQINAAKEVTNISSAASDLSGHFDITYTFNIENTGTMDLGLLTMPENLAAQFGAAFVSVVQTPMITGPALRQPTLT